MVEMDSYLLAGILIIGGLIVLKVLLITLNVIAKHRDNHNYKKGNRYPKKNSGTVGISVCNDCGNDSGDYPQDDKKEGTK